MSPAPARAIRVLCVDDHLPVRRSLTAILLIYDDMEMVGEAASGEEAVRLCADLLPDVVIMDIVMPGLGGVAATQAIRRQWPVIQVVGLSTFAGPDLVQQMREAGAHACLSKTVSSDDLADAIRAAFHAPRALSQTS